MLFSATYHLFMCHSERAFRLLLRLDLLGVTTGVCGCYFSGVYYGFFCLPGARRGYVASVSAMLLGVLLLQLCHEFHSDRWSTRRHFVYGAVVLFGLVPTMHWALITRDPAEVRLFLPMVGTVYALFGAGALFYLSRWPECCWPGRTDLLGSSHQLWHLCVLAALAYWHHGSLSALRYRLGAPCASDAAV